MTLHIRKLLFVFASNTAHLFTPLFPSSSVINPPVAPKKIDASSAKKGIASVYGTREDGFVGRKTASGVILSSNMMTVAHRTLPFGTLLRIINPKTGKYAIAKVVDRGPYISGRVLDLNMPVAKAIGFSGLGEVEYQQIQPSY